VAEVAANGVVTAKAGGTAVITVSSVSRPQVQASLQVTVQEPEKEPEQPSVTAPAQVKNVKATPAKTSVKLTWSKVAGATSYKVYGADATGKFKLLKTVKGTTYTDKKKKAATAYRYKVYAINQGGTGKASKIVKTITKPNTAKLTVKKNGQVKITLVSKATAYQIYKYNAKKKKYEIVYKVQGKKVYKYIASKKKFTKIGNAKQSKKAYTFAIKNIAKGKYVVKAVVTKKGYPAATGAASKAVTLK
jgi:hypothetical protein